MNQTIRSFDREASCISLINHKDDEKLLSESLYRNLHVLKRFHKATPDFLSVYEQHMFIKPNSKAFLHVFHFIFNCLDAAEFTKRFHWPIYGKSNETWFRKCTLDYVNRLNTIHQLGFETLKLHNIYIPGGFKFIKIVHKLSFLAMELTLRKHKGSIPNVNDIPDASDQLAKLEETMSAGFDFVARLETQSKILHERTVEMNKAMKSFFQESTINVTKGQCWSCLAEQWRNQFDLVVEIDVKPQLQRVATVSKISTDFEQLLTKILVDRKDNIIEYDNAKLIIAQNVIMKCNPDLEPAIVGMIQNDYINFDNLFQVFNFVLPSIMNKIEKFNFRDLQTIEYESDQIYVLEAKASMVQNQINNFEKDIQPFLKKTEERFRKFCLHVPNLPFNVMQTPKVTRKIDHMRQRFALMDDGNYSSSVKLFDKTLTSKSRSTNKLQNINAAIAAGCSTSMPPNKARNDALQILLQKKNSKGNATQSFCNKSLLSKVCSPKFSSAICSTAIKSHENKYHGNELQISPSFPNDQRIRTMSKYNVESATFLSPNPTDAMKKFPTNSAHAHPLNLRGSPTHRWEINDDIVDIPRPLNGNHDQDEAQVDIDKIIATLNRDEFLENITDSVLNNVSN